MSDSPSISVVVPCFNEEDVLGATLTRLRAVLDAVGESYEVVLVDDGSRDRTWALIDTAAHSDCRVRGLRLSRNFGHQAALTAGLARARGQQILIIDADLQDPPELLPAMRAKMAEGYDVVYGQRASREGETWFKLATANLFYRLIGALSDLPIPRNTGDFRLMNRKAMDALLTLGESSRFIRGMVTWVGFRQYALPYARAARAAGTTKYGLGRMVQFAVDAITSFSIRPLRLAILASGGLCLAACALAIWALATWFVGGTIRGWTSLMGVVLFVGAIQTMILGVVGEYIGRIFIEVKGRPLYIVAEDTAPVAQ